MMKTTMLIGAKKKIKVILICIGVSVLGMGLGIGANKAIGSDGKTAIERTLFNGKLNIQQERKKDSNQGKIDPMDVKNLTVHESGVIEIRPSLNEIDRLDGVIIDIREESEWRETGTVEGSIKATMGPQLLDVLKSINENENVIIICNSGNRSSNIAKQLSGIMPNKIVDVAGGTQRLISMGYKMTPHKR